MHLMFSFKTMASLVELAWGMEPWWFTLSMNLRNQKKEPRHTGWFVDCTSNIMKELKKNLTN